MKIGSITVPEILPAIPHASTDEKLIVAQLVTDLLTSGMSLSVYDGGEMVLERSRDVPAIYAALSSTDQDTLYVHKPDGSRSFVLLIWGNGVDVISDYGMSLDDLLQPANDLAEALGQ